MATTFSRKAGQKPSETPQVDIELTWSRDEKGYSEGRNFGHLAFAVDDIYETCARLMEAGVATPAGLFQLHIMPQTQETMPGRRPGHPDEGRRKNAWPWIAGSSPAMTRRRNRRLRGSRCNLFPAGDHSPDKCFCSHSSTDGSQANSFAAQPPAATIPACNARRPHFASHRAKIFSSPSTAGVNSCPNTCSRPSTHWAMPFKMLAMPRSKSAARSLAAWPALPACSSSAANRWRKLRRVREMARSARFSPRSSSACSTSSASGGVARTSPSVNSWISGARNTSHTRKRSIKACNAPICVCTLWRRISGQACASSSPMPSMYGMRAMHPPAWQAGSVAPDQPARCRATSPPPDAIPR